MGYYFAIIIGLFTLSPPLTVVGAVILSGTLLYYLGERLAKKKPRPATQGSTKDFFESLHGESQQLLIKTAGDVLDVLNGIVSERRAQVLIANSATITLHDKCSVGFGGSPFVEMICAQPNCDCVELSGLQTFADLRAMVNSGGIDPQVLKSVSVEVSLRLWSK